MKLFAAALQIKEAKIIVVENSGHKCKKKIEKKDGQKMEKNVPVII